MPVLNQEILNFLLPVIDANFMTLELYYNNELGAVIDRNKDTRCISICIAIGVVHIAIYRNTLFGVSLHPYYESINQQTGLS